jgi:hypothetical protein
MNLVVEMSVELKLLGLSTADLKSFNYNIMLNAVPFDNVPGVEISRDDNGKITLMNVTNSKLARLYVSGISTTDCWGTYTLVK